MMLLALQHQHSLLTLQMLLHTLYCVSTVTEHAIQSRSTSNRRAVLQFSEAIGVVGVNPAAGHTAVTAASPKSAEATPTPRRLAPAHTISAVSAMRPHPTVRVEGHHHVPFLAPEELMTAIQGHTESREPMAVWAYELSALHMRWIEAPPHEVRDLHTQIGARIGAIDAWVGPRVPRPLSGTLLSTDSVGGVVARVAEAWAAAFWTLHYGDDTVQRHRAWEHLAEIRNGYHDLIQHVVNGRIVLPKSWPGLGSCGHTELRTPPHLT